jgi:hypothetical protein
MKLGYLFKMAITLIFIISFSSQLFAQKKHRTKSQTITKNNANVQVVSEQIKKTIRDTLFKRYYADYKNKMKEYDDADHLVIDSTYGSIKLRFFNANNEPSYAPETIIPSYKDFIEGGLNKDSCNDLIVQ